MRTTFFLLLILAICCPTAVYSQALLKEAEGYASVQRWAEARDALNRLPPTVRRKPEVLRLLALAALKTGHHDELADYAGRLLAADAADSEAHLWLARSLILLAGIEGTAPDRREALMDEAKTRAEAALQSPDHGIALAARDLLIRARAGLGQIVPAREWAEAEAKAAPTRPELLLLVALALQIEGRDGDAIGVLRQGERLAAGDARFPVARGEIHVRLSQRAEAIEAFTRALACPDLDAVSREVAAEQVWYLFGRHRDFDGARAMVEGWLAVHQKDALGWWWRGYIEELAGEKDIAEGHYKKAWTLSNKTLGLAALHLGHAHARRREIEPAAAFMRDALKLGARPRQGTQSAEDAVNLLGGLYLLQRDFKAAANAFETYGAPYAPLHYDLQQNTGFALREYGSWLWARKKKNDAKKVWKRSAAAYETAARAVIDSDAEDGKKAQILNDTGILFHYHLNDIKRAVRYYEQALNYDPNYRDALENMGRAMVLTKRWAEAIPWFDRVLLQDPKREVSRNERALAEKMLEIEEQRKK